MNAIELLKSQHREVEGLFEKLERAMDDKKKEAVFLAIADKLAIHASIEEHHFYPAVKSEETEDILLESVDEHLEVKRALSDLLDLPVADETFDAKIQALKELVEDHVEEEEQTLFPKVAGSVAKADLEELAMAMTEEQTELEQRGNPRDAIPAETDKAAPI